MMISRDVTEGLKQGVLVGAVILAVVVPMRHHLLPQRSPAQVVDPSAAVNAPPPTAVAPAPAPPEAMPDPVIIHRRLDWSGETAGKDVRRLAQWVVDSADNGVQHFVILDKRNARVYVFDPSGKLTGASPVLLGYAAGDDTVPGIGEKAIADVKPQERTTPAGRFLAARGLNSLQEDVVWVDYNAAVSMHRVRATNPKERRLERLATPTASDNRISYGCINVPVSFFNSVLWPMFQAHAGVVYVLPEIKPLTQVFPGIETPYHVVSTRSPGDFVSGRARSAV